jgi:hypothetical protein
VSVIRLFSARFEAFVAAKIQVEVFWVVTPCSVMVGYRRFERCCCLHLQDILLAQDRDYSSENDIKTSDSIEGGKFLD